MYCKLLEEAIDALQKKKPAKARPEPTIEINVEAYIESDYIADAQHKLELYQRIAAIRKNEEIPAFIDELIDRFGEPTPGVMKLLEVTRIRNYARQLGIAVIAEKPAAIRPQTNEPTIPQRRELRHCTSEAPMPPAPTMPSVVASLRLMSKR